MIHNFLFKNILVTGGAGYVGAVLVPKLLDYDFNVSVLDWFIYGDVLSGVGKKSNLKEIKGDLRNKTTVDRALKGIDAVIHLACISNDPSFELNSSLGKTVNYDATLQLVDLAVKNGVKRFINASTSSVYGIKKEDAVTEDLSLEPLTDYSKYKSETEKYILSKKSSDCVVFILRPATICGYSPRMRFDLTVNLLTIQALVNKKITVYGGSQKRPMINIKDMADMYVESLKYPDNLINGKIYNVGYRNYTVIEIAKMVKKTLKDPSIQITVLPSNDLRSYHVSSEKIMKELGFSAKHSVEEAILEIKKAYRDGKFDDPLNNPQYYNIKMMQKLEIK